MRMVIKSEELIDLERKLLEYVSNVKDELRQMDHLKERLIWEGQAHDFFINRYDRVLEKSNKEVEILENLVKFLDDVVLGFDNATDNINGVYQSIRDYNGNRGGTNHG